MLRRFARPPRQSICLQCSYRLFRKEARLFSRPQQARFFASDDAPPDCHLAQDDLLEDLLSGGDRGSVSLESKRNSEAMERNAFPTKSLVKLYPTQRRLAGFGTDLPPLEDDSLLGPNAPPTGKPREVKLSSRTPEMIKERDSLIEYGVPMNQRSFQQGPPAYRALPGFGNKRLAGNRVLKEGSEALGRPMLGEPARAIVMRDGGLYVRKPSTDQVDPEPQPESVDISTILEEQADEPSSDDIRENISSLRPTSERQLAQRDFHKLQTLLLDGFTGPQLRDYLRWSTKQPDLAVSTEEMATRLPWVQNMTPWVPLELAADAAGSEEAHLAGYMSPSTSPKERIAVRILREAWGLSIYELAAGLGEVRVKVKKEEFVLLMRGTQRFLTRLGKGALDAGEKIESVPEQSVMRLVVMKPKADVIIAQLDKLLSRVRTRTIPLRMVGAEDISDDVLEEIGRITNTNVRRSVTGQRIHIDWLEVREDHIDKPIEDLRHVVFRLLLTAFSPSTITRSLTSDVADESKGRLITDQTNKMKWAWKDRLLKWQRFIMPSPSSEGDPVRWSKADHRQKVQRHDLPFPIEMARGRKFDRDPEEATQQRFLEIIGAAEPSSTSTRWDDSLQTSTVAHYGYVLHQTADNAEKSQPDMLSVADLKSSETPRIFSSMIPHPSRIAELEASAYEFTSSDTNEPAPVSQIYPAESTILMRFQPSPSLEDSNLETPSQALPTLELRLAADDIEVISVQSLRIIKDRVQGDVMMPGNAVDMRFSQTRYLDLLANSAKDLARWAPINDFLRNSRINLAKGKIETPDRQKFEVPRWLLDGKGDMTKKKEKQGLYSVSYDFVGLELHRAVSMGYKGFKMTYTSIEAGQGGGRRAELSVEAERVDTPLAPVAPAEETPELEGTGKEELEVDDGLVDRKEDGEKDKHQLSRREERKLREKEFVEVCHDLARDGDLWEGYSGDVKE